MFFILQLVWNMRRHMRLLLVFLLRVSLPGESDKKEAAIVVHKIRRIYAYRHTYNNALNFMSIG